MRGDGDGGWEMGKGKWAGRGRAGQGGAGQAWTPMRADFFQEWQKNPVPILVDPFSLLPFN